MMNRLANCHNSYQGEYPKCLCLCSAGLLRSPSVALYLSQPPFNCNTRAAGVTKEYALIPLDEVLIEWADHIVFANRDNMEAFQEDFSKCGRDGGIKPSWCLDLPDQFPYRDPGLMDMIAAAVRKCGLATVLLGAKTGEAVSAAPVAAQLNRVARQTKRITKQLNKAVKPKARRARR